MDQVTAEMSALQKQREAELTEHENIVRKMSADNHVRIKEMDQAVNKVEKRLRELYVCTFVCVCVCVCMCVYVCGCVCMCVCVCVLTVWIWR
jgi:hypothetical protein